MKKADIGLIGLAVMGENLVLNMERNGFTCAVYNRTVEKVDNFVNGRGAGKKFIGCHSIQELCDNLESPRRIMMMVKAGAAVDALIEQLVPYLDTTSAAPSRGNTGQIRGDLFSMYVAIRESITRPPSSAPG